MDVNGSEISQGRMRCLLPICWKSNFLCLGHRTSWDHSQSSYGNLYILLAIDYISTWVEASTTPKNDDEVVVKFIHTNILTRFGASRAIINDKGTHFYNRVFASLMAKYGGTTWKRFSLSLSVECSS